MFLDNELSSSEEEVEPAKKDKGKGKQNNIFKFYNKFDNLTS